MPAARRTWTHQQFPPVCHSRTSLTEPLSSEVTAQWSSSSLTQFCSFSVDPMIRRPLTHLLLFVLWFDDVFFHFLSIFGASWGCITGILVPVSLHFPLLCPPCSAIYRTIWCHHPQHRPPTTTFLTFLSCAVVSHFLGPST